MEAKMLTNNQVKAAMALEKAFKKAAERGYGFAA
jgi:hypothetical protein